MGIARITIWNIGITSLSPVTHGGILTVRGSDLTSIRMQSFDYIMLHIKEGIIQLAVHENLHIHV